MILRRHAIESDAKKRKYYTYLHDKQTGNNKKVDIYDICYEKRLYELKDDEGNIIDENRIENIFGCLEKEWSPILDKVENDIPLSYREECHIYAMFALQILRVPENQIMAKDFLKKVKPTLTDAEADRYAKISSLVAGEITPEINFLLELVLEHISKKYITIYHSKSPFLLNCHQPIYAEGIKEDFDCMNLFYPISKHTCIALLINKTARTIMDIPKSFTSYLNMRIYDNASRYVCSAVPVNSKEYER